MKIDILKSESDRIVRFLALVAKIFPEARGMSEVTHKAREGIAVEIKPLVHPHSRAQENYYRKWCREFGEYCGTTPDETHEEILCQAYGSEYETTRFGLKRRPHKRSSQANRIEYGVLIDTLIRVAAEMDFHVPPAQHYQ